MSKQEKGLIDLSTNKGMVIFKMHSKYMAEFKKMWYTKVIGNPYEKKNTKNYKYDTHTHISAGKDKAAQVRHYALLC